MEDRNKTQEQKDTQNTQDNTTLVKNLNPRANENLSSEEKTEAETEGAGSEITDGEDA